jgi:tryptophan synthase alpha chain
MTRNEMDATFERLRKENRGALILYLTAGYPDPARFVDLAVTVLEAGADALEIGIPFSDPLLDGPAIQRSQQAALDAGITPAQCVRFAEEIHRRSPKPLLFMGAYNPMLAYGLDRLCRAADRAGVTGIIVPDLPFEEQSDLLRAAGDNNIHVVEMAAPTSSPARMARVCASASGFIYCISVTGVTGARSSVTDTARPLVKRVRACTDLPVAVGFGIAGPEQASEVATFADGVIVGSALINIVSEAGPEELLPRARDFTDGLCRALVRPAA